MTHSLCHSIHFKDWSILQAEHKQFTENTLIFHRSRHVSADMIYYKSQHCVDFHFVVKTACTDFTKYEISNIRTFYRYLYCKLILFHFPSVEKALLSSRPDLLLYRALLRWSISYDGLCNFITLHNAKCPFT